MKAIIYLSFFFMPLLAHADGKWLGNIVSCVDRGAGQKNMLGTPIGGMRVTRKNNLSAAERLEYKKHGIKPDDYYTKDETYFSLGADGFNQGNFPGRWIANGTGRPEKCSDLFVTPLKDEITKKDPLLNMADAEFRATYEQANNGNVQQQYNLAAIYANGKKVQKNIPEYKKWLLKSAQGGYAQAQYVLALENKGDPAEFQWHMKAATQGHALAQTQVAGIFLHSSGINDNVSKAIYWYEKAAAQNDAHANFMLGRIYSDKDGGQYNSEKARGFYQRAATLGNNDAKRFLADLKGVPDVNPSNKQLEANNQPSNSLPVEPTIENANEALKTLSGYDGFGLFCRDGKTFSALLTKKEDGKWVLRKTPQKESCVVDQSKKFVFETVHE